MFCSRYLFSPSFSPLGHLFSHFPCSLVLDKVASRCGAFRWLVARFRR
jgi:hypothetical protein